MNQIQVAQHQPSLVAKTDTLTVNIEYCWTLAEKAVVSSLAKVNTVADAFFLIGYGQELGISPFAALRTIYVVNGVPTCSGEMMLALVRRSGLLAQSNIEELRSESGEFIGAKCSMTRKDTNETISVEFTLKDAKVAGLLNKSVWKSYPKNMCRWRAVSNVAKLLFSDVIGGLYTFEEIAHNNQEIDESGAPVGDIIESTATPAQVKQPAQSNKSNQAAQVQNTNEAESPPEDPPATTWLQESENKAWLLQTLTDNGLKADFYLKLDSNASSWTDIAKQYKDRASLEKAISDAMPKDDDTIEEAQIIDEPTQPQYTNTFDMSKEFSDKWDTGMYQHLCAMLSQYFAEDGDDLIRGGLGVEHPEKEYSSPIELWNEAVTFAQDTNVQLICNQFRYVDYGNSGRIETYHPILAVTFSRNKFVEMIGDKQFTDTLNIAEWTAKEDPYNIQRELVISYETKVNNKSGKYYNLLTSANIKQLETPSDPTDLGEYFG